MRKPPIDHSSCDHPRTKKARAICRRKARGLCPTEDRHKGHDHPATSEARTACNKRSRDRAVWSEDQPVVLEDITDPDVRAKVRRIAAKQEARLELRLLAIGLHITQGIATDATGTAQPRP